MLCIKRVYSTAHKPLMATAMAAASTTVKWFDFLKRIRSAKFIVLTHSIWFDLIHSMHIRESKNEVKIKTQIKNKIVMKNEANKYASSWSYRVYASALHFIHQIPNPNCMHFINVSRSFCVCMQIWAGCNFLLFCVCKNSCVFSCTHTYTQQEQMLKIIWKRKKNTVYKYKQK